MSWSARFLFVACAATVFFAGWTFGQEAEREAVVTEYQLHYSFTPDDLATGGDVNFKTEAEAKADAAYLDGARGPDNVKLYFNVRVTPVQARRWVDKAPEVPSVSEEISQLKNQLISTYQRLRDIKTDPSKLTFPQLTAINEQIDAYNSQLAQALDRNAEYFSGMRPLGRLLKQDLPSEPPKIEKPNIPWVDVKPVAPSVPSVVGTWDELPGPNTDKNTAAWIAANHIRARFEPNGTGVYELGGGPVRVQAMGTFDWRQDGRRIIVSYKARDSRAQASEGEFEMAGSTLSSPQGKAAFGVSRGGQFRRR